jgi:hypothetical protein
VVAKRQSTGGDARESAAGGIRVGRGDDARVVPQEDAVPPKDVAAPRATLLPGY